MGSRAGSGDGAGQQPVAPFWVTFAAGGISGTIGAVLTCPLEVVKTRMQVVNDANPLSFRSAPIRTMWMHVQGTMSALRGIHYNEGLRALWKGVGATVVGVLPARAIYFSAYAKSKQLLAELNNGEESSVVHLLSAAGAGIATATATNPIWLIKTRMQLQSSAKDAIPLYRNSLHCLQVVAKTEGLRGLYKGLTASYMGAIEGTIQWVLYEKMKRSMRKYRQDDSSYLKWVDFFFTAATAKLVAAIIAYPHEVLRTRLREDNNKYRGLYQSTMRIFREEGLAAFYGGLTPHLIRVVPNSAIMFFCYELMVHAYLRFAEPFHHKQQH